MVLMVDPLASSSAGLPLAVALLPHQRLHCRLFHCLRGSLLLLQAADHRPGQHNPLLRIHLNHGSYVLPVLWWVLNKSLCRWSWLIIHAVTSFFPRGREGSKCVCLILEMINLCLKSIFYLTKGLLLLYQVQLDSLAVSGLLQRSTVWSKWTEGQTIDWKMASFLLPTSEIDTV